jgi:two-component system chemotaxis sensor kinase CheA
MADRRSQKALAEFLAEAQETIDALAAQLVRLEGARAGEEPDPHLLNAVFRGAHSLKGISGMFGVERMARLAHALEDLLEDLRMGRRRLDGATLDLLHEAPDLFGRMIAEEAKGGPEGTTGAAERLAGLLRGSGEAPPEAAAGSEARYALPEEVKRVLTEYEEHRLRANAARGLALYRVRASFDLARFDQGIAELGGSLRSLGEVVSTLPASGPASERSIAFELLLASGSPPARVRQAAGPRSEVAEVPRVVGEAPRAPATPPAGTAAPAAASAPPEPEPTIRSVSQAVRVDIRKLDRLMNAVGELVLLKTGLLQLAERLRAGERGVELGLELQRAGRSLDRKLDELQAGILEVRMVPLGQVFEKLARMVRKVAREVGKEVELQVSGGEVELDKLIVEELSDPLMHLIRNAIDHAVEPPEVRERSGKPRAGRISVSAAQRGNHVSISVEDDGAGIDEERVRQVAVRRGVATEAQVRELSRREALNLVFVPGVSTSPKVTSLSGRGVGLDVVKNNIASLSGIIDLHSEPGRGTRFEITLPVTLAIVRALLVTVAGRSYAIPLNGVLEIVALEPSQLRTVELREVADLRGATVPLVRLGRFFGLPDPERSVALAWPPAKQFAVVAGLAQDRVAIAVDEVGGQQDVVVKPLGRMLQATRGIAGATDLGSRRTVLVLDVAAVIEDVIRGEPRREAAGRR